MAGSTPGRRNPEIPFTDGYPEERAACLTMQITIRFSNDETVTITKALWAVHSVKGIITADDSYTAWQGIYQRMYFDGELTLNEMMEIHYFFERARQSGQPAWVNPYSDL